MKRPGSPKDGASVSDYVEVEMRETNLKEFEEGVLGGDRIIKESYPLQEKRKMIVCYTLSKVLWRGDEYDYADTKIIYCCVDAEKNLIFVKHSINDPVNFARVVYQGKPVDKCPFCGAEIAIKQEF